MAYLRAYDREGNLIAVGEQAKGDKGYITLKNLEPHKKYEQGSFTIKWVSNDFETEGMDSPEFSTHDSEYKEFMFYAKDILKVQGLSAYQTAVKNGYTGTEEEWVQSIKGEPGVNADPNQVKELLEPYAENVAKQEFEKLSSAQQQDSEVINARGSQETLSQRLNNPNYVPTKDEMNTKVNATYYSKKPMVTFIDDDGRTEVLQKWEPILQEKGNKLTVALVSSWLENKLDTVIQWEDVHRLKEQYGVEFVNHTHEHKHAQQISDAEVDEEFKKNKEVLKREGLTHDIIVQPFGENTDSVRRISRKYAKANVSVKEGINTLPLDTYRLFRISLGEDLYTTFEQYKAILDDAISKNAWVIFKSHSQYTSFNENQLQLIRQIIDYCRENGFIEATMEEGLRDRGNLIDVGDYTLKAQGSDYYILDKEGKVHSRKYDKNYYTLKYNTISINTPITDFDDRSTSSVAIVSTNTQGFPNNSMGQLVTTKSEALSLSYQLYMIYNSNDIYKRRWDTNTNSWTDFEKITGGGGTPQTLITQTESVDVEVPASSYKDLNFTVAGVTNYDNVIVTPSSGIEIGLSYNAFITYANSVRVRIWNLTAAPVTTKRPYKITVIKNDSLTNVVKGLKGDKGDKGDVINSSINYESFTLPKPYDKEIDIFNSPYTYTAYNSVITEEKEHTYRHNSKSYEIDTGGNATAEIRISPQSDIELYGVQEFNIIAFIPDVSKVSDIYLQVQKSSGTHWSRSNKDLKNGWNVLRYYSNESDITNWDVIKMFRVVVYSNSQTKVYLSHFNAIKPEKARIIMVNDHGYKGFKDIAFPKLKALGIPTTFALNPGRLGAPISGASSILSQEEIEELSIDPYAEFSFHTWNPTEKATKDMTSEELKLETHKCIQYLKRNSLQPNHLWRGAFVQNLAPNHSAIDDMVEGYATYKETNSFDAFPFKNTRGINRILIHGIPTSTIDNYFEYLRKTHCVAVFYTHDISDNGGIHMTNEQLNYFISKVEQGINEGWLEGTTFSKLMTRYNSNK